MMADFRMIAATVILACAASVFADDATPFDVVKDGVFGTYIIDDLTAAVSEDEPATAIDEAAKKSEVAKLIGSLIRETCGTGQWTADGGAAAAMAVTPNRITIKAPAEVQRQVAGLMSKLREQRQLFIKS